MACILTACALDTGTSDDEESIVEAVASQQEVRGSYYAYRNGLGQTTRNAQGVNMTLENFVLESGMHQTKARFWPNNQLPAGDTQIDMELNAHCVRPNGTRYDADPAFRTEVWRAGKGRDVTFYGGFCYANDRLVLSRIDWSVDN